jgi:hypothetical protein
MQTSSNVRCFTVTSVSGAWINSHVGGNAEARALQQAQERGRGDRVEVRSWDESRRNYGPCEAVLYPVYRCAIARGCRATALRLV